jgi:hypothetical protein
MYHIIHKKIIWNLVSLHFKAWESEANVLCIVGEDDGCLNYSTCEHFMELVPEEHKHRFQLIKYPKAGHLIEPPYSPHCRSSFHKVFGKSFLYPVINDKTYYNMMALFAWQVCVCSRFSRLIFWLQINAFLKGYKFSLHFIWIDAPWTTLGQK